MLTTRIAAPPERVLAAAGAPIATGFAEPTRARVEDGVVRWSSEADLVDGVERIAELAPDGDGTRVTMRAEVDLRLPYFSWLFRPFVRAALRKTLQHMAAVLEARALGRPEPAPLSRPVWITREVIEPRRAATIASVAVILVIAGYGGGIFTNTVDFVAKSFHASDADLGVALAITRVGTFIGLIGSAMADRRGRRRILLASMIGVCGASTLSALAPDVVTFTMLQVIVRGCVQLAM
jgi:hypothetical protein